MRCVWSFSRPKSSARPHMKGVDRPAGLGLFPEQSGWARQLGTAWGGSSPRLEELLQRVAEQLASLFHLRGFIRVAAATTLRDTWTRRPEQTDIDIKVQPAFPTIFPEHKQEESALRVKVTDSNIFVGTALALGYSTFAVALLRKALLILKFLFKLRYEVIFCQELSLMTGELDRWIKSPPV